MLAISYMGTKRHLAPLVAELVADCKVGAMLDLFSGMCSVGQQVAPDRQVWSNDTQKFAFLVAKCQFSSQLEAPDLLYIENSLSQLFFEHMRKVQDEFSCGVASEIEAMDDYDVVYFSKQFEDNVFLANRLSNDAVSDYRLFVQRYAGTYFGLKQCIEIDGIRRAIDLAKIDGEHKEWCLVALCSAMAKCGSTTGHFAQALYPKINNLSTIIKQRRRPVWSEFLSAFNRLSCSGLASWRTNNQVFHSDAVTLLSKLQPSDKVGVVYADPPYTADQYSRFYHLYETLVLYDYPAARGRGLYRDGRTTSMFSHSTKVKTEIESLISGTARIGADLILSYPSNGLLPNSREQISSLIFKYYRKMPDIIPFNHDHSTMGASKGHAKHQVTELLYKVGK